MNESYCGTSLSEIFDEKYEFGDMAKLGSGDDLFALLESLDDVVDFLPLDHETTPLVSQKSTCSSTLQEMFSETELEVTQVASSPKRKRFKISSGSTTNAGPTATAAASSDQEAMMINGGSSDGQGKVSHITVERNRRKQMNEHLTVLRSLMPCFYVKRGDQASIIGGVVDYINELQQVLQSLEAKKQRKIYTEVLSPRLVSSSPRPSPPLILSPRKPPLSPRLSLPISPRTPQPGSPYKPMLQQGYNNLINSPTMAPSGANSLEPSPTSSSTSSNIINDNLNDLFANSKSAIADVEVKFSGSNVLLKTVSLRIPGQAAKIIAALEDLSLEILNVNISTVDETMFNSFTIKIGIECQLSAEELAHQIQQTFC